MRLKEILKESNEDEIKNWFSIWTAQEDGSSDLDQSLKDGKLHPKWAKFAVWANKADQVFDPPMGTSWWDNNPELDEFAVVGALSSGSVIIPSFQKMPNVKELRFGRATIKSFKGIEKLSNLEIIDFSSGAFMIEGGGLLSLLKAPKLRKFDIGIYATFEHDVMIALQIIEKHLKDKDIAECAEELIDAGLDEYAKL